MDVMRDYLMVTFGEIRARPRETLGDMAVIFALIFPISLVVALIIQKAW